MDFEREERQWIDYSWGRCLSAARVTTAWLDSVGASWTCIASRFPVSYLLSSGRSYSNDRAETRIYEP